MTPPKKKTAPPTIEAPQERCFRVTIITRKETIKVEVLATLDVTLLGELGYVSNLIQKQGGYYTHGLDGHLKPIDHVQRWIPLHMIEQVEVIEIS